MRYYCHFLPPLRHFLISLHRCREITYTIVPCSCNSANWYHDRIKYTSLESNNKLAKIHLLPSYQSPHIFSIPEMKTTMTTALLLHKLCHNVIQCNFLQSNNNNNRDRISPTKQPSSTTTDSDDYSLMLPQTPSQGDMVPLLLLFAKDSSDRCIQFQTRRNGGESIILFMANRDSSYSNRCQFTSNEPQQDDMSFDIYYYLAHHCTAAGTVHRHLLHINIAKIGTTWDYSFTTLPRTWQSLFH